MSSPTGSKRPGKKLCFTFSLIAIVLAVIATVLRIVSLFFFYDEIGYYRTGEIFPVVSGLFFVAAIAFFAIASRFIIKPTHDIPLPSKFERCLAILPLVAMSAELISLTSTLIKALPTKEVRWYDVALLAFGAVSVIFFISLIFSKQPSTLTAITGIVFILWIALAWMRSYLDFTIPMNSPDKLFFQLAAVGAALLVFADLRALYRMPQIKTYYFSFFTGILALSVSTIPDIIGNIGHVFARHNILGENIVFASLLICAVIRIICVSRSEDTKCDNGNVTAITEQTPDSDAQTSEKI